MDNVREFPVKQTPLDEIAKKLLDEKKHIRTAILVMRTKRGDVEVELYFPDDNMDDLLAIKQTVQHFIDQLWANGMELG